MKVRDLIARLQEMDPELPVTRPERASDPYRHFTAPHVRIG